MYFLLSKRCIQIFGGLIVTTLCQLVSSSIYFTSVPSQIARINSAQFKFACEDSTGQHVCSQVTWSLDGGSFVVAPAEEEVLVFHELQDGAHTLTVRLVGSTEQTRAAGVLLGNANTTTDSEVAYGWIVDTVVPETSILTGPMVGPKDPDIWYPQETQNYTVMLDCSEETCRFYYNLDAVMYVTVELETSELHGQVILKQETAGGPVEVWCNLEVLVHQEESMSVGIRIYRGSEPTSFLVDHHFKGFIPDPARANEMELQVNFSESDAMNYGWPPSILDPYLVSVYTNQVVDDGTKGSSQASLFKGAMQMLSTQRRWLVLTVGPGAHELVVWAVDGAGNVDATPAAWEWTSPGVPVAVIDSAPMTGEGNTLAFFRAHCRSSDGSTILQQALFQYQLDSDMGWNTVFGSEIKLQSNMTGGLHHFSLRCCNSSDVKAASNSTYACKESHASLTSHYTWEVLRALPETWIELGPPSLFDQFQADFRFTSDKAFAFSCQLDGQPWSSCDQESSFHVADGIHQLKVMAVNSAGQIDPTPAVWTWKVSSLETVLEGCPAQSTVEPHVTFHIEMLNMEKKCEECTFRYKVDKGGWNMADDPDSHEIFLSDLLPGQHNISVMAVVMDEDGNELLRDATPVLCVWHVVPDTEEQQNHFLIIDSMTPPISSSRDANFSFRLSGAESELKYILNGPHHYSIFWETLHAHPSKTMIVAASSNSSGEEQENQENSLRLQDLLDGMYLLVVCSWHQQLCSSFSWEVYTVEPEVEVLSGPDPIIHREYAEFQIQTSCEKCLLQYNLIHGNRTCTATGTLLQCSNTQGITTSADWIGVDFSTVLTVKNDLNGQYTLYLLSQSADGHSSAQVTYSWYVNLHEPETFFILTPSLYSNTLHATFTFGCEINGTAPTKGCSFEYQLMNIGEDAPWFPSQTSLALYQLTEGQHVLRVKATDVETKRVDSLPTEFSWTIDVTEPEAWLDSEIKGVLHTSFVEHKLGCSESNCSYKVRWPDSGEWFDIPNPYIITGLTTGNYILYFKPIDLAGNEGPIIESSWEVDLTIPAINFISTPFMYTPSTEAFFYLEQFEEKQQYMYRLDDQDLQSAVGITDNGTDIGHLITFSDLSPGQHSLKIWSGVENVFESQGKVFQWYVDIEAPQSSLTSAIEKRTSLASIQFTAQANEEGCIFKWRWYSWMADSWEEGETTTGDIQFVDLEEGPHTLVIRAIDPTGNIEQSPSIFFWVVDKTNANGLPLGPTGVTATAGNSMAFVSWVPPINNGGYAIQRYTVVSTTKYTDIQVVTKQVVEAEENEPLPTYVDFTNLNNGEHYCFKVKAENQKGVGPLSECSNDVQPSSPNDPCGLIKCSGHGSCFLHQSKTGVLQGYCVCRPGFEGPNCETKVANRAYDYITAPWGECNIACTNDELQYEKTLVYGEYDEELGSTHRSRTVVCGEFWGGVMTGREASEELCHSQNDNYFHSHLQSCGSHSCLYKALKVGVLLEEFYDDINFNVECRDAFENSFGLEIAYALHIQASRIANVNFWSETSKLTRVEFMLVAGNDPNEPPAHLLGLQLELQAKWTNSELISYGTYTPKMVPSSLTIEEIPWTDMTTIRAKNIAYDLMIALFVFGAVFLAMACYGFCVQKYHGKWINSEDDEKWWEEYFSGDEPLAKGEVVDCMMKSTTEDSKVEASNGSVRLRRQRTLSLPAHNNQRVEYV